MKELTEIYSLRVYFDANKGGKEVGKKQLKESQKLNEQMKDVNKHLSKIANIRPGELQIV